MANITQKRKAAALLHRIGGSTDFDFSVVKGVLDEVDALRDEIPDVPDVSPLKKELEALKIHLRNLSGSLSSLPKMIEESKAELMGVIDSTEEKIERMKLKAIKDSIEEIKDVIKKLTDRVNNFHGGGSIHRKILNNGAELSTHWSDLNIIPAGGLTMVASDDNVLQRVNLTLTAAASSTVFTETPSGLINGSNKSYTVLHTINNVYNFAINGQFIHPSEYTASGTTITFNTALDASLSGLSFTIVYG